eukprot:3050860-Prymnesium_polylepis.3
MTPLRMLIRHSASLTPLAPRSSDRTSQRNEQQARFVWSCWHARRQFRLRMYHSVSALSAPGCSLVLRPLCSIQVSALALALLGA